MSEQQRHWLKQGMLFGYPQCCIEAFLTLNHLGSTERKLHGTGFIPCVCCNITKTEEQLIQEINSNRCREFAPFKALEPELLYVVMAKTTERVYEHSHTAFTKQIAEWYAYRLNNSYYSRRVAVSFYITPILDI